MKTTLKKAITTCAAGAAMILGLCSGEARAQQAQVLNAQVLNAQVANARVANARVANASVAVRTGAAAFAPATQQVSLGNLSEVNQGATRYRYSREGVTWDFIDRNGHWTCGEAVAVRDALDRLPIGYLRKARWSGCDKFYRDGAEPQMPLNSIFGKDGMAAVAVPVWPFQYVAFGDGAFAENWTYPTTVHELGHCAHWYLSQTNLSLSLSFSSHSWLQAISLVGDNGLKSWNGFVTDYARTNYLEDFAESAEWYWLAPDELCRVNSGKYWYMRNNVFDGVVSPAEARVDWKAIGWVTPQITCLSSYSGDQLTVRDVYGNFFMAPGDGGYNTVRFSQVTALHVPVSRTHMYATVPASCNPSPNWYVTVETQDGKSNGVKFEVTQAWWRFW